MAKDPENAEWAAQILKQTDDYVVIKDKYPKARFHVLVVPRKVAIDTPSDVLAEHAPLLRQMLKAAKEMISERLKEEPKATFRIGFHSSPSMQFVLVLTQFLSNVWFISDGSFSAGGCTCM